VSESGETRQWLKRLWRTFAAEPRNRQDLLQLLREARERGLFEADALTMIEGVLAVSDLRARDVMVPRVQMVCVQRDDPVAHILPVVIESGHSRFPVLDEDRDDIAGILLAKDLLRLCGGEESQRFDIREYMRPAVFVPESKRLDVLLKEFRVNHQHMAVVVDEYGGVAGLITIEDVIEQIVGEIDDEFDVEDDQNIRKETERQYLVRGLTRIEEFNEYFGARLPEEQGFETVAGLLMRQFGRLPRRGESVSVNGFEFRITRADRRRIDALRVVLPAGARVPHDTESTT
jgi:magnesium and cobalt transporter